MLNTISRVRNTDSTLPPLSLPSVPVLQLFRVFPTDAAGSLTWRFALTEEEPAPPGGYAPNPTRTTTTGSGQKKASTLGRKLFQLWGTVQTAKFPWGDPHRSAALFPALYCILYSFLFKSIASINEVRPNPHLRLCF